ncbi:PQQ-binding-like beta-propeller repeat protein [Streptomyces sp. NPDC020858]|uniref:PQQ-binding-like beta-propeller repeat protein n=1 Tax=Streptomyces sp. NPDC020858 TaxID=3365097 RepID=UPI00379123FB
MATTKRSQRPLTRWASTLQSGPLASRPALKQRWSFMEHCPRVSPAVDDGIVYSASADTLYALHT